MTTNRSLPAAAPAWNFPPGSILRTGFFSNRNTCGAASHEYGREQRDGVALELRKQHDIHGNVIHGGYLLNRQLIGEDAANEIGQVTAAEVGARVLGMRNGKDKKVQDGLPEPIDEKDDAQAFAGLVLVVAVKLRQLCHKPETDTHHSEGEAAARALEKSGASKRPDSSSMNAGAHLNHSMGV